MNLALGILSIKHIYPYNKQNDHWKIDNLLKISPAWIVCHYWRNCSRNDQICLLSLEDSEMKEKQKQSIKHTNPLQNEIDWSVLRTDMIAKKQKSSSLKILDKYCGVHTFFISLIATLFFYFQCVLELWGQIANLGTFPYNTVAREAFLSAWNYSENKWFVCKMTKRNCDKLHTLPWM